MKNLFIIKVWWKKTRENGLANLTESADKSVHCKSLIEENGQTNLKE